MYTFPDKGHVYITGKIGSFLAFFLSQCEPQKIILFYDGEDEALLSKKRSSSFREREVLYFPAYSQRIFEKEDESKRIAFLHHLTADETFIGLYPSMRCCILSSCPMTSRAAREVVFWRHDFAGRADFFSGVGGVRISRPWSGNRGTSQSGAPSLTYFHPLCRTIPVPD